MTDVTTTDAERVSDNPKPVAWRWRWGRIGSNTAWHVSLENPLPFVEEGYEVEPLYTADIIEAQSKALAEAREALAEARSKLAADYGPADADTRVESYWSDYEALAICRQIDRLTPTPENPNG